MDICNLPQVILEKILIEGNFYDILQVNQTWRNLAIRNQTKFNDVFFDLTKDDSEKIKKKNLDTLLIYNSKTYDKNGLCVFSTLENKKNIFNDIL